MSSKPASAVMGRLKGVTSSREMSVLSVIVVLCIALFFSGARDHFYSQSNFQNLTRQISLLAIFAIGEAIVIITGGIDLSLGSLIAFTGVFVGLMLTKVTANMPFGAAMALAIVATLAVAAVIGLIHAAAVHFLRIPPFVVTLGTLSILRSQSQLFTNAVPIPLDADRFAPFNFLSNGMLFAGHAWAITVPVIVLVIVAAAYEIIMRRSKIGRYVFAIGGNEEATRLSGVDVFKTKAFAFCSSALLGGLAGLLYAAYNRQGDPSAGVGYELNAVAAAVIGGASLMGGQGSIIGTVLGACLLQIILSGINLMPWLSNPSEWEGTVVGGIVLLAVLFNVVRQRRQERRA